MLNIYIDIVFQIAFDEDAPRHSIIQLISEPSATQGEVVDGGTGQMSVYDIHHLIRQVGVLQARMDAVSLAEPSVYMSPPTYRSSDSMV